MADDVSIKFGADIADLQKKVGDVMSIFGQFTERFAALAAVVAGGAAFKEFIDTANRLNSAAEKMSRTLGITTGEAGAIAMAVDDVAASMGIAGASADTYTGAFLKFNRQLRTNSDGLRALGVDVDAVRNGQKTSNQVFQEALQIVGKYAPGIDQTQVAMQMFGRSVQDVQLLMGITSEKIEEARKKAESLNLTITSEGIEGARRYRAAMNDVHDVLEGLKKTIGEGVMPHLTAMAEKLASIGPMLVQVTQLAVQALAQLWDTAGQVIATAWDVISTVLSLFGDTWQQVFGKDGPGAMEIFKNALRIVEALFIGFRITFELSASMIKTGLTLMGEYMVRFANVADRALHFDFAGARAAWKSGVADHNRILEEGMADMVRIAAKGAVDLDKVVNGPMEIAKGTMQGKPRGGTLRAPISGNTSGDANTMAAKLALLKAQLEAERSLEQEYLKEAQSMYDDAYKNGRISTQAYYDAKLAIEVRGLDSSLNAKRQELQEAKKAEDDARARMGTASKPEERNRFEAQTIKFQTEQVKLTGEIAVLEAQRVDAVREVGAAYEDVRRKVDANLQAIATARAKTAADNEVAIEREALQQRLALRQISAQAGFQIEQQLEDKSYAALQANLAARRAAIYGSEDEVRQQKAQLDAEAEAAEQQHQLRLTQIDHAAVQERNQFLLQAQTQIENSFGTFLSSLGDSTKSIKDKFLDLARSIEKAFMDLAAKQIVKNIFGNMDGGTGSTGGWLGGLIGKVFGGLPSFDVGTEFVPHDMIAKIHKGEKIVPASQNKPGGSGMTVFNNFTISGPVDSRTQMQIASAAGRGVSAALSRNG